MITSRPSRRTCGGSLLFLVPELVRAGSRTGDDSTFTSRVGSGRDYELVSSGPEQSLHTLGKVQKLGVSKLYIQGRTKDIHSL